MSLAGKAWLTLFVLVVLVAVIGAVINFLCLRAVKRVCPTCKEWIDQDAKKCPACHEWLPRVLAACVLLSLASVAQASPLLDCAGFSYWGPACVIVEPVITSTAPSPPPPQQAPLFRKEEMAPDTPQLMLHLLEHPTPENAERFLAWQAARQRRIVEVQHLLRTAPRPQP